MEAKEEEEMKDFWKMIFASMLINLVIAFLSPILAVFVQNIGEKSVISIGFAFAASFITQAIVSFYFGKLADKHGQRKFLILGNLIYCVVPFSYLFVSNLYQIIFVQIIMGLGIGMGTPAYYSLLSEKMKKGKTGFGFGILNSTTAFVIGIGALVGSSIVQFLGFNALFIVMGIIQIIQTLLIATVKE